MSDQAPARKPRLLPPISAADAVMVAHGAAMMGWLMMVILTWGEDSGNPASVLGLLFLAWAASVPPAWLAGRLLERRLAARARGAAPVDVAGEGGVAAAA